MRDATLWARRPELAAQIDREHENAEYLPGIAPAERTACDGRSRGGLHRSPTSSWWACRRTGSARCSSEAAPHIGATVPVVSLAKGVEQSTLLRMTEVMADVLPGHAPERIGVLTGPNLAREVAERAAGGVGRRAAGRRRAPRSSSSCS